MLPVLRVHVRSEILRFRPLPIVLFVSNPDLHILRAVAHEIERLAIRRNPRLLIDESAVDGVWQTFGRWPVCTGAGPLAGLADAARDENVRRGAEHTRVPAPRKASKVDGVAIRRDSRLIAA